MIKLKFLFDKVINLLLISITYVLSYIIPKNKYIYIFWSSNWYSFSWNSKEIFLHYKKNKKLKLFYISDDKNLKKIIWKDFIYRKSFKAYILLLRAKLIFLDSWIKHISILYALIWNFNIILLWHWDWFKKIEFENPYFKKRQNLIWINLLKNQYKNIKLWITWNNFNKKTLNKSFLTNKFKVTWLPRNNIFIKNINTSKLYNIKNFNLKWYKKILLYTPTWRDSDKNNYFSPFSNIFYNKLNNFLAKNNYLMIFKPHYLSKIKYNNKSNILILPKNIDIQEIMNISDILITDYSSIFIDFLLTWKKIIFYTYDYSKYINKDKDLYLSYNDIIINESNAKNETDLLNIIKKIDKISNIQSYKSKYNKLLNFFHQYNKNMIIENIEKEINKL